MIDRELPKGWEEIKLGEIVHLKNGYAFNSNEYKEFGIPVIRISDIKDGKITTEKAIRVSEKLLKPEFVVEKGDILVAMSGATTGKYGIYNEEAPALQNQRVGNFKPYSEVLISKPFVYYLVGSLKKQIEEDAYGGAQPNISSKMIEKMNCILPPLAEQKRIVAKLDEAFQHLDTLKAKLARIPELLKTFRQAVLTQAVTGKLTEEWREVKEVQETGKQFINRIIDLQIKANPTKKAQGQDRTNVEYPYGIPNTWTFGYLQNFGEVARGKSKHRPRNDKRLFNGPYPFIQTGDVAKSEGYITEFNSTYSEFGLSQSRLFPKGTLCITIAANIADTGILTFDACFPDSVVGYIPFENLYSSEFAMFHLRTVQRDIEHFAPATAQKNINLQILSEVPFPVPPLEEQKEIVKKVEALFAKADAIETYYTILKEKIDKLPQALLAKAFRGELVPQNPEDESASVLLEKIKATKVGTGNGIKKTAGKIIKAQELELF